MQYALLIYQNWKWIEEGPSETEIAEIGKEYADLGATPGLTSTVPLGYRKDAMTVRVQDGKTIHIRRDRGRARRLGRQRLLLRGREQGRRARIRREDPRRAARRRDRGPSGRDLLVASPLPARGFAAPGIPA